MSISIAFSIQKGGSLKTTTTGATAYLLTQQGYNVLCVDFDPQGNLTYMLTQKSIYNYNGKTVFEAIKTNRVQDYILEVEGSEGMLSLIPSNDYLAMLPRYLAKSYLGSPTLALKKMLDPIRDNYDFILFDTPPMLGEHMTNCLAASDMVVIPYSTDQFHFEALKPFYETVDVIQKKINPQFEVIGILPRIVDAQANDTQSYLDLLDQHYPNLRFESVIKKNTSARRLGAKGFYDNKELRKALRDYNPFVKELLDRVRSKRSSN